MIASIGTVSPQELMAWIASLAFFVGLLNGLGKLADRVRGKKPKPPNEQLGNSLEAISERLDRTEKVVERNRKESEESATRRTAGIYREINTAKREAQAHTEQVRKELAGAIEAVDDKLSDKIDSLPDRLITTLRNFGTIGGER